MLKVLGIIAGVKGQGFEYRSDHTRDCEGFASFLDSGFKKKDQVVFAQSLVFFLVVVISKD